MAAYIAARMPETRERDEEVGGAIQIKRLGKFCLPGRNGLERLASQKNGGFSPADVLALTPFTMAQMSKTHAVNALALFKDWQ
jgi:hypothetical protein